MGTAVFAPEPTCGFFLVQVTIRCPCLYSSMMDIVTDWTAEGRKSLLSSLVVEVFSTQTFFELHRAACSHGEKNQASHGHSLWLLPRGSGHAPLRPARAAEPRARVPPSQNVTRISTLQACMKKFQVVSEKNTFVPSTGIFHVISLDHMKKIN